MLAELDRLTRDHFEIPDDAECPFTHLDYAEGKIAAGETIQKLADGLTVTLGFGVDRETLRQHLYSLAPKDGTPESARLRLARAREEGAHSKMEQAEAIADTTEPESGCVAKARLQVQTRQFTAERWNPAELAAKPASTNVMINLGQLHLDALRAVSPAAAVTGGGPMPPGVAIGDATTGALLAASNAEVVDNA